MNPLATIKRTILRTLRAAGGAPMPGPAMETVVRELVFPIPLQSDINAAIRELKTDGFILGQRDAFDMQLITWTLTDKGAHQAAKL